MRKQAPTETHETGDTSVQEGDGRLWLQTLGHVKFGELVRQLVARVHALGKHQGDARLLGQLRRDRVSSGVVVSREGR